MRAWLAELSKILQRGDAAMLVHVASIRGSAPREAGAQMLVTEAGVFGTIGGGELEHSCLRLARQWLHTGHAGIQTFSLGPDLAQCCGGSVTIAFEPFAPADLAWLERLSAAAAEPNPVIRTVRMETSGAIRRDWSVDRDAAEEIFSVEAIGSALILRERMNQPAPAVWLFGAGHVGRAVAAALHPLDFALTWIDGRAGQFPDPAPPGVRCLSLAMPELIIDEAPADTTFLVMTHSHALDEAICEAVLRRADFGYLGLIGSLTKRARFRRRLAATGIPQATARSARHAPSVSRQSAARSRPLSRRRWLLIC